MLTSFQNSQDALEHTFHLRDFLQSCPEGELLQSIRDADLREWQWKSLREVFVAKRTYTYLLQGMMNDTHSAMDVHSYKTTILAPAEEVALKLGIKKDILTLLEGSL